MGQEEEREEEEEEEEEEERSGASALILQATKSRKGYQEQGAFCEIQTNC